MTEIIHLRQFQRQSSSAVVSDADMARAHAALDAEVSPTELSEIVATADQLIDWASEQIMGLLAKVSYGDLVRISNACADRDLRADHHFLNEIICEEFGRRHQQVDPENYPPTDGAA